MQYIFKTLAPDIQPTGVFSKAVCSHVASQKAFAMFGMKAVAIEVNFMRDGLFMKELRRPGEVFSFAGLGCANVIRGGKDLAAVVASMEEQAAAEDILVLQFFLNLDSSWGWAWPWNTSGRQVIFWVVICLGGLTPKVS